MTDEFPSRTLEKVVVRLPDGMRDALKVAAESNKRSVNAEIVARLGESFGWDAAGATLEQHLRQLQESRINLESKANTLADLAERYIDEAKAEKDRADELQRRLDRLTSASNQAGG